MLNNIANNRQLGTMFVFSVRKTAKQMARLNCTTGMFTLAIFAVISTAILSF